MKEQLISFETAKLAKEKGFKTDLLWYHDSGEAVCYPYYVTFQTGGNEENIVTKLIKDAMVRDGVTYDYSPLSNLNYYHAPTQSLLQKWLREKHGLHIDFHNNLDESMTKIVYLISVSNISGELANISTVFTTYEKALEQGLTEALKLVKSILTHGQGDSITSMQ